MRERTGSPLSRGRADRIAYLPRLFEPCESDRRGRWLWGKSMFGRYQVAAVLFLGIFGAAMAANSALAEPVLPEVSEPAVQLAQVLCGVHKLRRPSKSERSNFFPPSSQHRTPTNPQQVLHPLHLLISRVPLPIARRRILWPGSRHRRPPMSSNTPTRSA